MTVINVLYPVKAVALLNCTGKNLRGFDWGCFTINIVSFWVDPGFNFVSIGLGGGR